MNRFISAVLAAAMALSMNWMFAYADVGTPKTTSATLKATANSTYTITVPESVAMTGASGWRRELYRHSTGEHQRRY